MSGIEDRELREAFGALREDEARQVPDFARTMARVRDRGSRRHDDRPDRQTRPFPRTGRIAALALAAAAVLIITIRSIDLGPPPRDLGAELLAARGVWRGPTDFLLEDRSSPLWESTTNFRETLNLMRTPQ